jgi:Flp pilus assembly protein protease CpaA
LLVASAGALSSAGTFGEAPYVVALVVACLAALTDLAFRTIPNGLTYGAIAAGLVLGAVGGWAGLSTSALGMIGLGVPFAILFQLGALGGGDVKLVAAFGALLGFGHAAETVLAGTLATGLLLVFAWILSAAQGLARWLVRARAKPASGSTAYWGAPLMASPAWLLASPARLLAPPLRGLRHLSGKRVPFAPGLALAIALGCGCKWQLLRSACLLDSFQLRIWP